MHLPSLTILGSILSLRQATPSYELYSSCATVCFDSAAKTTNCVFTTEVAWIACLCHDGNAQAGFAQCVYTDCGGQVLNDSAAIHIHNCQVNGSPSALSEEQFIADGEAAGAEAVSSSSSTGVGLATSVAFVASTSSVSGIQQQISSSTAQDTTLLTTTSLDSLSPTATSAVPNTEPTPTKAGSSTPTSTSGGSSTSSGSGGSGTLSTAALIGTIIASLTGAVGSCIGVWFGWKTYKHNKNNKKEEQSSGGN